MSSFFYLLLGVKRLPHVVISGDAPGIDLSQDLVPLSYEDDAFRIKTSEIYIERQENRALISTVVIEEGHPQSFYILVTKSDTENHLTIRLDPSTDPIKTRGVKRSIAVVAEDLIGRKPNLAIKRHNIQDYLDSKVSV